MKVLMVNYEFPPIGGGGGNANYYLLREYAGMEDLQVDLLTSGTEPGLVEQRFAENIRIFRVGIGKKDLHFWRKREVAEWLFRSWGVYRRLLAGGDYDLAHAFFGFPSGWFCRLSRNRVPYIISLRGSDVPGYNERLGLEYILLSGVFRGIWKSAQAVVANSSGLRELAYRFFDGKQIQIIPNGVDTELYRPGGRRFGPGGRCRLLTVCRLIKRKRLDVLIRSVAVMKSMAIDAELTIAGDGNMAGQLRGLVERLGLGGDVHFLGVVEPGRMAEVYREHDIFLMSSRHEGMSNAMLEAMASGLPVVTSRCEGVRELIADNGMVVDCDARAFAQAVKRLIFEIDFGLYSRASRARALEFGWAGAAREYRKIYDNVAGPGAWQR